MRPRPELHEDNRKAWNAATRAHNSHKPGQAEYLGGGGSTLFAEELQLLGEVRGKKLLHLCCNAGPDTLSLAARGAIVTGVDISDEAIDYARRLSSDSGIPGEFERADVYDFLSGAGERRWDVAFFSYGALGWLSDLDALFRGVAAVLNPGGRLVGVEFHPVAYLFDEQGERRYSYFYAGEPLSEPGGLGDYVAASGEGLVPWGYAEGVKDFQNPHVSHYFPWNLAEKLGAVLRAGLVLERFEEWPYANGCKLFDGLVDIGGRRFAFPEGQPDLPLMYGLAARKA